MGYIEIGYDGALFMRMPEDEYYSFVSSGFYKLSVKRYVKDSFDGIIWFKRALTYLDYKRIISLMKNKFGEHVYITDSLKDYIEAREIYIEKRSRLGMEIKKQEDKLFDRYLTYKQIVDSRMSRHLRERQMWDSFYMCAMQKSANFSVPGSGKTSSVLGMYAYLKTKELVKRIVVVCPKNAFGSWIDEFEICFRGKESLHVLNIHDSQYHNRTERRKALLYHSGACNLILVNYESVGGVREELLELINSNTLLVFDEVHKVKRVDGEYAEHAVRLAKEASYVVAMTGTPIPNSYTDIYNMLHILFPNEYDEFFDFSVAMLRNPGVNEVRQINDKLQPFFCRTTKDQLGVPRANADIMVSVNASEEENKILQILKMKYRKNKLALFIRILQMESNPKSLLKNLNLADFKYLLDDSMDIEEIDFVDYSDEIKALISNCNISHKFVACVNQIKQLVEKEKTVVVWCVFVDSIKRLSRALDEQGIRTKCVFGEVALEDRQEILHAFKHGEIQVLLTNPHTLAESVSLHSVCHDAVYFEYSYNLVHLLQSKDRIHRLGLKDDQYTQYYYMKLDYQTKDGEWSMDHAVYERLKEKEQIMLDAIDNHVLEAMPTSEEDMEVVFRKLGLE